MDSPGKILERVKLFDRIYDAINCKQDWGLMEFILLYASILDFKPQYILELGRSHGNSLYTISIAADDLDVKPQSIESVCLSDIIFAVRQMIDISVGYRLNESIKIIKNDFLRYNYESLREVDNILIFYDIHGKKLMEHFISKFVPILKLKRHIVIFHDFSYYPGMDKKSFIEWKRNAPAEYKNFCFAKLDGSKSGGFISFDEVLVLLECISQKKINLPYSDFIKYFDKNCINEFSKLVNYRKDFSTSLISVVFN